MNLSFNEEQMRAIVTKALIEGIGEEQKTLIIQQAVEHLMEKPEENRGYPYNQDKRNRLQRAFDGALEQALMAVACEEVAKPENMVKLRAALGPVVEAALSDQSSWQMKAVIGRAIAEAFAKADS